MIIFEMISLTIIPMMNSIECLTSLEFVAVLNPLNNKTIDQTITKSDTIEDTIKSKISFGCSLNSDFGFNNSNNLFETVYNLLPILKIGKM